jgi:hypothetical protein
MTDHANPIASNPDDPVEEEEKTVREIVQKNLKAILGGRSPEEYCGKKGDRNRLRYRTGTKAGKPVAPRTLRYAIEGNFPPKIELIEAVAEKEDLAAYQILHPHFQLSLIPVVISKEQYEMLQRIKADLDKLRS